MARRRVQYGVVNAADADVGAGAPGFRATWQSKDDLRQLLKMSDVPNGKLYFWDGELWLRWDDPDDLPGPEGDPLRIKIVCPGRTGILLSFCACSAGFDQHTLAVHQYMSGAGSSPYFRGFQLMTRLQAIFAWPIDIL